MGMIRSVTQVKAPMERCFKLAVSIDLQMAATGQKAIDGTTSGLIGPGETVTWQSPGLIGKVTHKNLIEVWRPHTYFRDIMVDGPFAAFEHDHHFAPMNDGTRIRSEIRFTSSKGVLGRISEKFFLRKRMAKLLRQQNALLKRVAESDEWHEYLDGQSELDMRVYQAASAIPEPYSGNVYAGY
jgi:ligand-binding SRPBCC domain-containing protein